MSECSKALITQSASPPPCLNAQTLQVVQMFRHVVRHRRQRFDWDCGLACVQMVLPEKYARNFRDDFQAICREEGFSKSTWTIDLCYLLQRYNLPHVFYTLTLGAHADYKNATFYSQVFADDEGRVNQRFAEAEAAGLRVRCASLKLTAVLSRLHQGPAIALTDSTRLACNICKRNRLADLRKCLPLPLRTNNYMGHYIVLCGYDLRLGCVYYRNPACHDHYCVMSLETFEESRRAFGTDEDIIFLECLDGCR